MTRRQLRRHVHRHPFLATVAVLVGLVLVLSIAAHLAGLVILAAVGAGGYALGRNRRPAARPAARRGPAPVQPARPPATSVNTWPGPVDQSAHMAALTAERDRLRGEVADLGRQLGEAKASAEAAWDASASRAPFRRVTGGTVPLDVLDAEQLAAQPMSGVRRLGGSWQL